MANKRKTVMTVRTIAQMVLAGKSKRCIAEELGISRNTIKKYLYKIHQTGMRLEEFILLEDKTVDQLMANPPKEKDKLKELKKMFPHIEKELRRVGVTRWLLWEEYKGEHPGGYSYTQFCYHYQQWCKQGEVTMHFEHKAGDKLFVDYAGKRLSIVDWSTGEIKKAEVFVALLGASQLTYVEASLSQKKEDFIASLARSFEYFGGVPSAIVPDNLRSAVTTPDRYEPKINETFADFGRHYNTHVLATRSRKPRDKALVEKTVSIIYSRIYARLRDRTFYSLSELNNAIRDLLEEHNRVNFKGRDYSRMDLFLSVEKETLNPLPAQGYEIRHYAFVKVQKHSHIHLSEDKHYYSVPYRYIGKKVKVVYTGRKVDIYYKYERIAFHKRDRRENRYTTVKEHLPPAHQFVMEWNPGKFITWAESYGEEVREYIKAVLHNNQHVEQNYKSCIGILGLGKKYGKQRLINACRRGAYYSSYNYRVIRNILEKGLDTCPDQPPEEVNLPEHNNIRGKDYYQ